MGFAALNPSYALLERIDKNPRDREAWDELAGGVGKLARKKAPPQRR